MEKKRILFIDDNQGILDGLRRALRKERSNWDMVFASSGEDALELMSHTKFDAVITDMCMPGVDGVHLLNEVYRLYPETIRFVLSGHSKEDTTLQSVKLAHQFFPKPCNIESLKSALIRSLSLRDLLADSKFLAVVSGVTSLPSFPQIYSEILEELNSPEYSVHAIGETISKDPAISAKILQLVNSAFFGLGRQISHPAEAATLLGLDIIKQLVLTVELFSQFDTNKLCRSGFSLDRLLDHSIRVGMLAKQIALSEQSDKVIAEQSYLAGFLHDIGQLILVDHMPEQYKSVLDLEHADPGRSYTAEQAIIGTNHTAVGAYLLGLWGFADAVLEAVAFHHAPIKSSGTQFSPLTAVHIANELDNARAGENIAPVSERLDMCYLSTLGIDGHLGAWEALCEKESGLLKRH